MTDAGQLSQMLANQAEDVARMLYPTTEWQKIRRQLCMGSLAGEKGESLKLDLSGARAGNWRDFATAERGDLIDLWRISRNLTAAEAFKQVRDFLGVKDDKPTFTQAQKTFKKAEPHKGAQASSVVRYLTEERKLTLETLRAFRVESRANVHFKTKNITSDGYYLPYYQGPDLAHWKIIALQRTETGKKAMTACPGPQCSLYGWQALDPNVTSVVLTEGEIDAMALHQVGIPALSIPGGAGTGDKLAWIEYEYGNLERFSTIFICMDNDDEGKGTISEMVRRLGQHRCRVVDLLYYKDPNAALQDGRGAEFFRDCLDEARHLDPEELKNAADFVDQVERLLSGANDQAYRITLPWPKTHGELRLEESQLTIWSGFNGHGKSEMLLHFIMHRMALGERACIASLEVPAAKLIGRHLLPMAAAMPDPAPGYRSAVYQWLGERLWLFNLTGSAKADRLLEVFEYARKRYGCQHFVIDSLLKVGLAEDDYSGQKKFIEQICDFKNATGAHVHLVTHCRKRDGGEYEQPKKHDIRGSGSITDLADNVLAVYRNKAKEEALSENPPDDEELSIKGKKYPAKLVRAWPDAYLYCYKQREDGIEPAFKLWFDRGSRQFLEAQHDAPRRYVPFSAAQVATVTTQP